MSVAPRHHHEALALHVRAGNSAFGIAQGVLAEEPTA